MNFHIKGENIMGQGADDALDKAAKIFGKFANLNEIV